MSGLVYIGPKSDTSNRIVTPSEVSELQSQLPTLEQVESDISTELSDIATKSYVDTLKSSYATNSDITSARAGLLDSSALDSTVAQLTNGQFPTKYFSKLDASRAQFFTKKETTNKVTHKNDWGSVELLSLDINNSYSTYYIVLAWGKAEVKPLTTSVSAGLKVEASRNGKELAWGASPLGYNADWDVVVAVPTEAPSLMSGARSILLSAVKGGGTGDNEYSGYETEISAITIPVG